jgi:hypothetical protein
LKLTSARSIRYFAGIRYLGVRSASPSSRALAAQLHAFGGQLALAFHQILPVSTEYMISRDEFEERRDAFALCAWINAKLRALRESGQFDQTYFDERKGTIKYLIEEAIPISRLGLYLSRPESQVHIRCFADGRAYDAQVEVTGFTTQSFKVEVTTSETEGSAMRRQALARDGVVHLTGQVRREGRRIVSDGEMVDVAEEESRIIQLLLERLRVKVTSDRYDAETAFLVYASEFFPVGLDARAQLARNTKQYLLTRGSHVPAVYYCFWPDYSIVHVQPPNYRA